MSRDEKIQYIVDSVHTLMEYEMNRDDIKALELMDDDELDSEVDWYDYLWGK